MASFQLEGIPQFGASIAASNTNAPQSSDANAVVSSINQANELQRSGANNVGLQALSGINTVAQSIKQIDDQQALKTYQQQVGNALANKDTGALQKLYATNPAQAATTQQALGMVNDGLKQDAGQAAMDLKLAFTQGPQAVASAIQKHQQTLQGMGIDPNQAFQISQTDPQHFNQVTDLVGMHAVGPDKYFDITDKQQGRQIQMRGQDITSETARRGQDITARGQDISASTARRGQDITMRGQDIGSATARRGQDMAMQRSTLANGQNGDRTVQLADGRTVSVSGKLHGSGANAFYDGTDDNGNSIRVPAGTIAAPAGGATSAGIQASSGDISTVINAYDKDPDSLGFATGITGGVGTPAKGADYISRYNGKEQRQLFTALQRIQGRMQNQGVGAAKEMGASGINTVAEAKMYFQSMPQVDYSSPESAYQSVKDIDNYTKNYNQQYNVNVGGRGKMQQSQAPAPSGSFTSSSGIKFKVTP